jgi:hypothetical protein
VVKDAYEKLKELDSELAQQYAYLGLRGEEAQRAADQAKLSGVVVWEE